MGRSSLHTDAGALAFLLRPVGGKEGPTVFHMVLRVRGVARMPQVSCVQAVSRIQKNRVQFIFTVTEPSTVPYVLYPHWH